MNGQITNLIGHAAGVLIFGIFLYLVLRQRPLRNNWLSPAAAALALLWNLSSLAVLLTDSSYEHAIRLAAAIGFSALSILPAVLLRLALAGRFPWLARSGALLSAVAVVAHVVEYASQQTNLHRLGLFVITVGFGLLTTIAALAVFAPRFKQPTSRPITSRLLATMSLFLLAISFAHFGDGHIDQAWSQELAFHHVGIPLALFVLMQEYRFVLLDAFVRFLANGLLAGVAGVLMVRLIDGKALAVRALIAAVLLAVFALCRESLQNLLTRVVFRQPRKQRVKQVMQILRAHYEDEPTYLMAASEQISQLMNAPLIEGVRDAQHETLLAPSSVDDLPRFRSSAERGARVVVPIRLSLGESYYILLGARIGGRPYLSEDLEVLARVAAITSEQVERVRAAETGRLVSQAELRALQAQINPHFLFNALNTVYGIIPREASVARRTVLNLADLFRYFLRSDKSFVAVEEEMHIVEAYLAIEAQRLGEKLKVEIRVDPSLAREPIPVLSIQPLVENAIKHGIVSRPHGGTVIVAIEKQGSGIRISISDTGPGFDGGTGVRERIGIGLKNVTRRLQLCYGPDAEVLVESSAAGSRVSFVVPAGVLASTR